MSAPERIWAWKHRVQDGHWIGGVCTSKPGGMATEYARADLLTAMTAERDAAREAALREAAEWCETYQDWAGNWGVNKNACVAETAASECKAAILALIDKGATND